MNKKTQKINLVNMIIIVVIFLLELMLGSVKLVFSGGEGKPPIIELTSYFPDCEKILTGLPSLVLIIALITISIMIINAVMLVDESVKLTIISTVLTSVCLLGSVLLVALVRKYVTIHNLIIMLLFLVTAILNSVKLRISIMRGAQFVSTK